MEILLLTVGYLYSSGHFGTFWGIDPEMAIREKCGYINASDICTSSTQGEYMKYSTEIFNRNIQQKPENN